MKLVIANWKMNLTLAELAKWLQAFENQIKQNENLLEQKKVILAPSYCHLPLVRINSIDLAGQNCAPVAQGTYTGQVGILQLKDFCQFCIVGHSETGDTTETILAKRDLCLKHSVTPIVCFSQTELAEELYVKETCVCWEDPATISSAGKYRNKPVEEIAGEIGILREKLPEDAVLLYGGSVNRQNSEKLGKIHGLDGVLVGNASLDPLHFVDIISTF